MKTMRSSSAEDPEMKQLSNMLTKIQAIQNPDVVTAQVNKKKASENAFFVLFPPLWMANKK
jgi:hypothetical protein